MTGVPQRREAQLYAELRNAGESEERQSERRGENERPAAHPEVGELRERLPPRQGMARAAWLHVEEDEQRGQERKREKEGERHADRGYDTELRQRPEASARERDERGHGRGAGEEARRENPATRGDERRGVIVEARSRLEVVRGEVDAACAADHEDHGRRSLRELAALPSEQRQRRESERSVDADRREARHDRGQRAKQEQKRREQHPARTDRDAHHRRDGALVRGDPHGSLADLVEAEARPLVGFEGSIDLLRDGEQCCALGRHQLDHDRAHPPIGRDQGSRPEGVGERQLAQARLLPGPAVDHEPARLDAEVDARHEQGGRGGARDA
jgi:hypothetical protein